MFRMGKVNSAPFGTTNKASGVRRPAGPGGHAALADERSGRRLWTGTARPRYGAVARDTEGVPVV
jgi:hypothetical protein